MHEHGKSDKPIVPKKSANNGVPVDRVKPAESMEGRGLAKGNSDQQTRLRTPSRIGPATSAGPDTRSSRKRMQAPNQRLRLVMTRGRSPVR